MATAWWALPLLLQGRYAFNFLPYVEQAATTTGTVVGRRRAARRRKLDGLPQPRHAVAARGLGHGHHPDRDHRRRDRRRGRPVRAGHAEHARRGLAPAVRRPRGGRGAGRVRRAARRPVSQRVDQLLDGALAPFRNVYKLEPVIAVALALGLAHAAATWLASASRRADHARPAGVHLVAGPSPASC